MTLKLGKIFSICKGIRIMDIENPEGLSISYIGSRMVLRSNNRIRVKAKDYHTCFAGISQLDLRS